MVRKGIKTQRTVLVHDLEPQRYSATFHSDSSFLFVLATVHVSHLAGHPRRNNVVRSKQGIHQSRFSMIYVPKGGDYSNVSWIRSRHGKKSFGGTETRLLIWSPDD